MKMILPLLFISCIAFCACGQSKNQQNPSSKIATTMNLDKITNPTVKDAIEALQSGNIDKWLSLFTYDAQMTDDGNPKDFKSFSAHAIGHEKFTTIDKVENDGKEVYGQFHSDQWGDFNVFFKFFVNSENKINRLDIGQDGN